LLLGLSLLERKADDPEATVARAAELQGMVDRMLENLHRMAMNLRPASLDHLGLVAAMDQYCETFGQQHDLDVQFETVGLEMGERLLPEVETALYRIVQEALTNVIRHAQAEHVDVLLERRGDHVVTIVEDDGVGFDTHEVTQSGRLGVFGMHERAEMLDGNLVVESAPGTGTTVFVEVPYADQDPHR
jgi:signal transduction histidine kinase